MFVKDIKKGLVGVALLGAVFVGCGGNGLTEFEPKDEMDNIVLEAAKKEVPNTKFYRTINENKEDVTKREFGTSKDIFFYRFTFINDKNVEKTIGFNCSLSKKRCEK